MPQKNTRASAVAAILSRTVQSLIVPARKQWFEPTREPNRPLSGYIGLQNHEPGDVVWFKEVNLRRLPPVTGR